MRASRGRLRIKRGMSAEKPTVWIGKGGAAPRTVDEISRQLERKEVVKVKVLKSALKEEVADVAAKIAEETGAALIDVRGHTFVLYKPQEGSPA